MNNQPPPDEPALLARIALQDQAALAVLYDRYARLLYSLAFKILDSTEEAEEIVLDVFSQVWRTAKGYDTNRGRVDTWLFMMTRSRCLDRLRALKRLTKVTTASQEIAVDTSSTVSNDPAEEVWIRERRAQVLAALKQLPPEQRQVLELAYYQGLSHTEIAVQTGMSLGTVKSRIRLGLSKLRDALGAWQQLS